MVNALDRLPESITSSRRRWPRWVITFTIVVVVAAVIGLVFWMFEPEPRPRFSYDL